ncbi:hypothetical protein [Streptomyces sp. NPDC049879]|uniref:hypothetical protein n=1 Tax=Streptomyces sp. NPDC049879 TaxID=3365598 RepID=UPI0037B45A4F
MAGFRYSPQWDQHAGRDTDIVDPVLVVRPLARFEFTARRPVTQVDHALVFTGPRGALAVYVPPHRPTRGELGGGRFVSVHEVDMGIHHFRRALALPSDDDAFSFTADIDVSWRVVAPDRVVVSQVRDVPAHVVPRLEQRLRTLTRAFAVEDSAGAEHAVREDLSRVQLAEDLGVHLTYAVSLDMDAAAREHHSALRDIRYQAQRVDPQAELDRMREMRRQELDLMRQAHDHRLQRAELTHEQQMLSEKARFYAWHLEQRGVVPWALEVAQRPQDLPKILEMLDGRQQAKVVEQLGVLDRVVSSGHFEDYQLEEPVRQALTAVRDLFTGQPAAGHRPGDPRAEPAAIEQGRPSGQAAVPPMPSAPPPDPRS